MGHKKVHTHEAFIPQATAMLRDAALRVTQARLKVLACLLAGDEALSHNELHPLLPGMDRVTLYRALDALVEAQLAHKIATNDRAFRYHVGPDRHVTSVSEHQHGHFKCTGCGKVFCLTPTQRKRTLLDQLQKALQQSMEPGFQGHDVELTIKGWCAACARS